MRDQFLLGLQEGPIRQSLRRQLRQDSALTFEDLRREALALERDHAEVVDSSVCMAASGASVPVPPGSSDWKQVLRAEFMKDVREEMAELSKTLLEEFRRRRPEHSVLPVIFRWRKRFKTTARSVHRSQVPVGRTGAPHL